MVRNSLDIAWTSIGPLSPLLLLAPLLPLRSLLPLRPLLRWRQDTPSAPTRPPRSGGALITFLPVATVLWLAIVPRFVAPRYYVGPIAVAEILLGAVLAALLDAIPARRRRLAELPLTAYLGLALLLTLAVGAQQANRNQAVQYLTGSISRDHYLSGRVRPYAAERWADAHLPAGAMIAMVAVTRGYYLDHPHLAEWYHRRRDRLEAGGTARAAELALWCAANVRYAIQDRGSDELDTTDGIRPLAAFAWTHLPRLHLARPLHPPRRRRPRRHPLRHTRRKCYARISATIPTIAPYDRYAATPRRAGLRCPLPLGPRRRREALLGDRPPPPRPRLPPTLIGPKYWDGPDAIQREGVWLHGICPPRDLYGPAGTRTIAEALAYARDLLPALRRLNVDLIDACAFPYFPWFSARAIATLRRTPLLTTWPEYWGPYWRSYLGPAKGSIAQLVEGATVRLSADHLCLSPFTEQRLRAVAPRARITPIPAGIDAAALARYQPPPRPVAGDLFIGRLLAHKRVADLLQALALARQPTTTHPHPHHRRQRPRRGRPPCPRRHPRPRHRRDLPGQPGEPDLYAHLGHARCLVLPSEREGQGIVVAEAQAVGTPPIVAAGPETAAVDFVRHDIDGLLYPVGDIEALARHLQALAIGDDSFQHLQHGCRQAATALDWDAAILPRMATLYRQLLR